ncbi:MAG: 50S ribosomal protein L18e [Nanoarchaeota archaeon]
MIKTKSKIEKQMKRKTNPEIVASIIKAKKNKKWLEIAGILSSPRRKKISVNIDEIDKNSKEGDTIIVPGKVLGTGDINKKIRVAALSFSLGAEKKLKERKCEIVSIEKEIKLNPEAKGIKILK